MPQAISRKEMEAWLDRHTRRCPLGRVSYRTCRSLRNRPGYGEAFLHGKWPVRPTKCERCNWLRYFAYEAKEEEKVLVRTN